MYGYFNKDNNYIYEIEIPQNAIHNENTMECVNKETANYETNKFIIRKIINIKTKETIKKYIFDVINHEYNYKQEYWKTYYLALQCISFIVLQKLNITERNDFPSVFRTYYMTGQLCTEFYHNKGIVNGPYKFYESDDTLTVECNFVNGKIHGICKIYDEYNDRYLQYIFINGNIQYTNYYYYDLEFDKYLIPRNLESN